MISTPPLNPNFTHIIPPRGFDPLTCCPSFSFTKPGRSNTHNESLKFSRLPSTKLSQTCRRITQVKAIWGWFDPQRAQNDSDIAFAGDQTPDFLRFLQNDEDGGELQTAVVRYRRQLPWSLLQPGLKVDLVAAVHIADKKYFEALQKELADYDRVLYEMVVDKDSQQPSGNPKTRWMPPKRLPGARSRKFNLIGFIQRLMAYTLTLDFQLDCIDYRRDNWYHADLDYKTFKLMQLERDENLFELAVDMAVLTSEEITEAVFVREGLDPWRSKLLWASRFLPMPLVGMFFIESICASSSSPISKSLEMRALFRLDLTAAIKLFLAKQLTSFSELTAGKTKLVKNSVIIGERNRVAIEELRAAIDDGCKRIAILYGGGHMPDMDQRLRTEFGLVPIQISWRTAWSIKNQRTSGQKQLPPFLKKIVKSTGWQLNRYQSLALLILSLIFAVDLWLWELFFSSITEVAKVVDQDFIAAVHFLTQT